MKKPVLKTYIQWFEEWGLNIKDLRPEPDKPPIPDKYWYGCLSSTEKVSFADALHRLTYGYYVAGWHDGVQLVKDRLFHSLGL